MKEFTNYYLDGKSSGKYLLKANFLRSSSDLNRYDHYLSKLPLNPFVKKELLMNNDNVELGYFTLHDQLNKLLVLLPFILREIIVDQMDTGYRDVISPYGFIGPIMHYSIDGSIMQQFWSKVDKWYRKNNVISEFVRFNINDNALGYTGSIFPTMKMVRGKILNEEEQWANFRRKVRANVRIAKEYKLYANVYHKNITLKEIQEFYGIYIKTMDRHNAEQRYRYDLDYFIKCILNNPSTSAIVIVYRDQNPISAEYLLLSEDVIYSFLGGTDESYFHTRPNDFLKFAVLDWGRTNGFKYYFLGGGKIENDSLYRYKKQFFPKDNDITFYTGRKILDQNTFNKLVALNPDAQNCKENSFFPLYRYKANGNG